MGRFNTVLFNKYANNRRGEKKWFPPHSTHHTYHVRIGKAYKNIVHSSNGKTRYKNKDTVYRL